MVESLLVVDIAVVVAHTVLEVDYTCVRAVVSLVSFTNHFIDQLPEAFIKPNLRWWCNQWNLLTSSLGSTLWVPTIVGGRTELAVSTMSGIRNRTENAI